jgi:hypothetical protein
LKFALHQHERGWIIPDSHPIINDLEKQPYHFLNYPEKFKLHFCRLGIEQVAQANLYAALLCSKYYCQLLINSESADVKEFIKKETVRHSYLIDRCKIEDLSALTYQITLMRFCINLSLYLCMNKVGTAKLKEVPQFKNGFEDSEYFHKLDKNRIIASYRHKDSNTIRFNSQIFETDFEMEIPCRVVLKTLIAEVGLADAYHKTITSTFSVKLCKDPYSF